MASRPVVRAARLASVAVLLVASTISMAGGAVLVAEQPAPSSSSSPAIGVALNAFGLHERSGGPAEAARVPQSAGLTPSGAGIVVVGSVQVGSTPEFSSYDPSNGYVYVADTGSGDVSILNGTTLIGNLSAGNTPYRLAYDNSNGYVYVTNAGGANVSVINGTSSLGSVAVGSSPQGPTYDPLTGIVYVTNRLSNNVSLINGTSVDSTVDVGSLPDWTVYDPATEDIDVSDSALNSTNVTVIDGNAVVGTAEVGNLPGQGAFDTGNGYVYIPDGVPGTVSVLNGTTLVATLGDGEPLPVYATYDSGNGFVYVSNCEAGTVSVINGTTYIGTVGVGGCPFASAYDDADGDIYVPNAYDQFVSVINGTTVVATISDGSDPWSATYDSANSYVYVANEGSNDVSVIHDGPAYQIEFNETGLPTGTPWTVQLGGVALSSNGTTIDFVEPNGTYGYQIGAVSGWTTQSFEGVVVANGSAAGRTVPWTTVSYSLAFTETGLPSGSTWSVTLGGGTRSSTSTVVAFTATNGTYLYTIGAVSGWRTSSYSGSVSVGGTPVAEALAWTQVVYAVRIGEDGLPAGSEWGVNLSGGPMVFSIGTNFTLTDPNGTYTYSAFSADRQYSSPARSFVVDGSSSSATLVFSPVLNEVSLYPVVLSESGLPQGTKWSVQVGEVRSWSTTTQIDLAEINGSYTYSLGEVPGWTASAFHGAFSVGGASIVEATTWSAVTYSVTLIESGLPAFVDWSATLNGREESGSGGITFRDLGNGTYPFAVGRSAGYLPTPPTGSLLLAGLPDSVAVHFDSQAGSAVNGTRTSGLLGLSPIEGYVTVAVLVATGSAAIVFAATRSAKRGDREGP